MAFCRYMSCSTSRCIIADALTSKYLSDPTEDVRVATENILADFLREIRQVTSVRKRAEEQAKSKRDTAAADGELEDKDHSEETSQGGFAPGSMANSMADATSTYKDEQASDLDIRDIGCKV
jgi:vacuole morphology and inheritance protein 14